MFFTSVEACLAASLTSATALVAACLAASTFCAASSLSKQPVTAKAEPKTNASVNFFIIFSIE